MASDIVLDEAMGHVRGPGGTWLVEHGCIQVLKRIASGVADASTLAEGLMTPERLAVCEAGWRRQLACIGIDFGRREGRYFLERMETAA